MSGADNDRITADADGAAEPIAVLDVIGLQAGLQRPGLGSGIVALEDEGRSTIIIFSGTYHYRIVINCHIGAKFGCGQRSRGQRGLRSVGRPGWAGLPEGIQLVGVIGTDHVQARSDDRRAVAEIFDRVIPACEGRQQRRTGVQECGPDIGGLGDFILFIGHTDDRQGAIESQGMGVRKFVIAVGVGSRQIVLVNATRGVNLGQTLTTAVGRRADHDLASIEHHFCPSTAEILAPGGQQRMAGPKIGGIRGIPSV